jgi:hypothetical protein
MWTNLVNATAPQDIMNVSIGMIAFLGFVMGFTANSERFSAGQNLFGGIVFSLLAVGAYRLAFAIFL